MREGYLTIADHVVRNGRVRAPRGEKTMEVTSEVIRLLDPRDSLPVGIGRGLNPAIAAIEALQLIGGFTDPELVCKIAPRMVDFMDAGKFYGSYGPRIGYQLPHLIRRLQEDTDTRRAVLAIWHPDDIGVEGMHDYPCTTRLTFSIINGAVVLETSMRSNDVYWGLSYDVFQFTQLQMVVAACLDLDVGDYYHHATSLHVYERDFQELEALSPPTGPAPLLFEAITGVPGTIESYQSRAWGLVYSDPNPRNETEKWFLTKLARFN